MGWLELIGLGSGLLCVWLLIKEHIWTFPIGLVYALVSVVVFVEARLYADSLLSGYYILMNAYGWYFWLRGGERTDQNTLSVSNISITAATIGVGLSAAGILAMGLFFDTQTNADFAYWDSTTTVLSFLAMWMSARKYIESWWLWLIIDVIATVLYFVKGIYFYSILYGVYLVMAVMGWQAWRNSQRLTQFA